MTERWKGSLGAHLLLIAVAALFVLFLVAACDGMDGDAGAPEGPSAGQGDSVEAGALAAGEGGADPDRGPALMVEYGCGACHTIPGVRGANGLVGPPLTKFGSRAYIAGAVPNTDENLVQWIIAPDSIEPGTVMPILGVSQQEARDIAAYLMSLR